ncbi:hypothetical protein KO465_02855 [Candidatus Micrarchaeota archaeon]|jgi:hypothetical protein|nr:hypothetical protein [Candidatus Micrarchaeota archaeon]
MKKIMILMLVLGSFYAFSPEPTNPLLIEKCESTGGTFQESYFTPDCGIGCRAMPMTLADCYCPDGKIYTDIINIPNFSGCDGSEAFCHYDDDCMRTNQGNTCIEGVCAYVQQPWNPLEGLCLSSVAVIIGLVLGVKF